MNDRFDIASRVENVTTPLECTMSALNFWAAQFENGVNDILMEDDEHLISWVCKNQAAGYLAVLQLITCELEGNMDRLMDLSKQLYAEAREKREAEQ